MRNWTDELPGVWRDGERARFCGGVQAADCAESKEISAGSIAWGDSCGLLDDHLGGGQFAYWILVFVNVILFGMASATFTTDERFR
jgi:hypothetical protein